MGKPILDVTSLKPPYSRVFTLAADTGRDVAAACLRGRPVVTSFDVRLGDQLREVWVDSGPVTVSAFVWGFAVGGALAASTMALAFWWAA